MTLLTEKAFIPSITKVSLLSLDSWLIHGHMASNKQTVSCQTSMSGQYLRKWAVFLTSEGNSALLPVSARDLTATKGSMNIICMFLKLKLIISDQVSIFVCFVLFLIKMLMAFFCNFNSNHLLAFLHFSFSVVGVLCFSVPHVIISAS